MPDLETTVIIPVHSGPNIVLLAQWSYVTSTAWVCFLLEIQCKTLWLHHWKCLKTLIWKKKVKVKSLKLYKWAHSECLHIIRAAVRMDLVTVLRKIVEKQSWDLWTLTERPLRNLDSGFTISVNLCCLWTLIFVKDHHILILLLTSFP